MVINVQLMVCLIKSMHHLIPLNIRLLFIAYFTIVIMTYLNKSLSKQKQLYLFEYYIKHYSDIRSKIVYRRKRIDNWWKWFSIWYKKLFSKFLGFNSYKQY